MQTFDRTTLEKLPGIFMVGNSGVGKRTLISRLLNLDFDFEDSSDSSSQILVHGWTINTKYYTADVSIWMAQLDNGLSIGTLPMYDHLAAMVMVFDMNDLSSLLALKEWVSRTDIHNFEILLCIGNKVDLIPGHPVHAEYRRRLQKHGESSSVHPYPEFNEYEISETEGSSLLRDEEETAWETSRRSCLEWCSQHNIEYIEACASNADFDKCLSVDGDSQGVERLYGALSAYMWPGMILKSGNKIIEPSFSEREELSEEESDYEFEYEVLSAGSAEPWDNTDGDWISANQSNNNTSSTFSELDAQNNVRESDLDNRELVDKINEPSTSMAQLPDSEQMVSNVDVSDKNTQPDEVEPFDFEDLEQLMSEIGNVRDSLRYMPDFQRREMAAKVALKMASMFGGGSDDEEEFN